MNTEYVLKFSVYTPTKEALVTFTRACKTLAQELSVQAALLSGETPDISLIVTNNKIGTKEIKVFKGDDNA